MDIAYRLLMYLLMANVGYMMFSLFQKGFKHYSGYISQLFFLLCLMIVMLARDVGGGMAISISLCGIGLLVLLPMYLQRHIDALMAENRFAEIEPYARWKANLAWTEMNVHLHELSLIAEKFGENAAQLEHEMRTMLNRGEPFDGVTRVFLGLIHFNNRNFAGLIDDLRLPDKPFSEQSFEELLYLVRAYLETTRYDEAAAAQIALEKLLADGEDPSLEKRANLVISRMIFFAFLGWNLEFDALVKAEEEGIERLPASLKDFWCGVCLFNSGDYVAGEKKMAEVISASANDEHSEAWLPFMRKRFHSLLENRDFFDRKILSHLKELYEKNAAIFNSLILEDVQKNETPQPAPVATNVLSWLIMIVSVILIVTQNVEDIVSLIDLGANSSFLVKEGEYFRLFTYQFIHIGWVHLLMNLVALKFFGPPVERITGWPIYIAMFFISGIAGGMAAAYTGQALSAGASASVLGLLSIAIVFEFFKVKGAESLTQRNNFSTLLFILVINLIIGAVEKGVDNSAHLGGLLGGAILAVLLLPVLKSQTLKRLAGFVAVWAVIFIFGLSSWQMYSAGNRGFYPRNIKEFAEVSNASATFALQLPTSWKVDPQEDGTLGLEAVGPFRERVSVLIGLNSEPAEDVLKEYVEQRTKEIENTGEITLHSRRGPELLDQVRPGTYRVRWLIDSAGGPLSVIDYLVLEDDMFFMVRFFIGTEADSVYAQMANHIVASFRLLAKK
ncbi:MAG: rhomboid family intramembrane serine protease [Candidatus Riflebacteria bacterium]|nr:rhomboid family intramembrane serine protease [Candidatus Riflebacteria bacterium]